MKCFQCASEIEGSVKTCPVCFWSEHDVIPEDDPRYLVYYTLILRATESKSILSGRLEPTPREFAVLEHGDQCRIDDVLWRITAKNRETGAFYVRAWKAALTKGGSLVTCSREKDIEVEMADRNRNEAEWKLERKRRAEQGDQILEDARKTGRFDLEHIEWMTEEDWELMSREDRDDLIERYESTIE